MSGGEGIPGITLKDVEQFFFDAPGYGSGAQKIVIPELPDDKFIVWRDGLFEMIDQYSVTPDGPWSSGVTKIRYNRRVVWVTHYGGYYFEEVIPFLKLMLLETTRVRQFIGGRGPRYRLSEDGSLAYVNTPEQNDFANFRGREEIFHVKTGESRGFHYYWGMAFMSADLGVAKP